MTLSHNDSTINIILRIIIISIIIMCGFHLYTCSTVQSYKSSPVQEAHLSLTNHRMLVHADVPCCAVKSSLLVDD